MEAINRILEIIASGTSNPVVFFSVVGILALACIAAAFFYNKYQKNRRGSSETSHKEEDKGKDISQTEQQHTTGDTSIRDRLKKP